MTRFNLPPRTRPNLKNKIILCVTYFTIVLETTFGREADDRSRFLYADDPNASIILEYQLHNAPSADYSGDERKQAAKRPPGAEYDEEKHIKPYFLSPENGPRVVEYYSPWCGHCQAYKPKYIALAKEINRRLPDDQMEVNFHAVSCSVHHWVCMQNNVKGFPTIVAFRADSAEPQKLKRVTAETVAEAVGVRLLAHDPLSNSADEDEGDEEIRPVDILGASLNGLARTRETVYKDAALSFTYALRTGIYPKHSHHPLEDTQKEVFSDWIDLLYWTLPPTWILHTLINDLRINMDSVVVSKENLLEIVDKHQEVVNGKHLKWSDQCAKGVEGAGYPCGLWSLFHIVSIGVVERHKAVLGSREEVSTQHVALTLRNYIENFFACEACRQYFTDMHDSCGFDHCKRFKQSLQLPSEESWGQFALWLFEVHNDINMKLIEEEWKREGKDVSELKSNLALWPSQEECPGCRDKNGKWDKDVVLKHLKKSYWPAGVQNFRFVVLKKKDRVQDEKTSWSGLFENFVYIAAMSGFIIWCMKKQYISLTGRHKKYEGDYYYDNTAP